MDLRNTVHQEPRRARRPRVVVVEDDPDLRETVGQLLKRQGYAVTTFANGVELVDYLATWILRSSSAGRPPPPIDAIVTDVRMPGFDGLGIVLGLRAKGWSQPVVVMSAYADERLHERMDGLDDLLFLAKPFELTELSDGLQTLLHS